MKYIVLVHHDNLPLEVEVVLPDKDGDSGLKANDPRLEDVIWITASQARSIASLLDIGANRLDPEGAIYDID